MKFLTKYFIFWIFFSNILSAQYKGNNFSISSNYSFNTSAKIFLTPNAPDILDQNLAFGLEDISSYSFELRYRINEALILGVSAEYMQADAKGRTLQSRQFIVREGFKLYPFEISAYYFLPFSTDDFKFYMGGGIGIYTGKRTREFGDIRFKDVNTEVGYGIQVSIGMDYMIFNNFSAHGELRFRDPDFKITNKYNSETVTYNGNTYLVSKENIVTKVNVDGITFRAGIAFHFSLFN